ncbi:hypothetical protein K1719_045075 [Acacia pycnantha]|nr:hypothetical protein K1719_045075 [Acacia pycnantha]
MSNIDTLPEDCVAAILSFTSPADVSRFLSVSSSLRSPALSDLLWLSFLPSDYPDLLSRSVTPVVSSSKRDLFFALSRPFLIDSGSKSFQLDRYSGKKSYILSARELSVTWGDDPMLWSWIPMSKSRFSEVAHLRTVSCSASEVTVEVGNVLKKGKAYLCTEEEREQEMETRGNGRERLRESPETEEDEKYPWMREDGWMEIELGEFYSGEQDQDVKMSVREVGYRLKGGLIVEGIQIRPKR